MFRHTPSSPTAHRYKAFISYSHAADRRFAPALQLALERFAASLLQRRTMSIFRDEANLTLSPNLWGEIETALGESEFFVLLASPEAAQSPWVRREVQWWLEHRDLERLLLVVTGGELAWSASAGDFDWATTTALPAALQGKFTSEPLYCDVRWAQTPEVRALRQEDYEDAIATIAATLQGVEKSIVAGRAVAQYKKNLRNALAAAATLGVALVAAVLFGGVAVANQNQLVAANGEAETNRINAGWASLAAERTADVATAASQAALRQFHEATRQTRIAVARRLVAESELVRPDDPTLSALLAIASSRLEPLVESWRTLFEFNSRFPDVTAPIPVADAGRGILNDDGSRVLLFRQKTIELWNVSPRRQIWNVDAKQAGDIALSGSGKYVAYRTGSSVVVRDVDGADTWQRQVDSRPIEWLVFSPDEEWMAFSQDKSTTILWRIRQPEQSLRLPHDSDYTVMFGADGQVLTFLGGTASLWRLDAPAKPVAHWRDARYAILSGNGKRIAVVRDRVEIHSTDPAELLVTVPLAEVRGVQLDDEGTTIALRLAEEEEALIVGSAFKGDRDFYFRSRLHLAEGGDWTLTRQGDAVVMSGGPGAILYSAGGERLADLEAPPSDANPVGGRLFAVSGDGGTIALGGKSVIVRNTRAGPEFARLDAGITGYQGTDAEVAAVQAGLKRRGEFAQNVALTRDGKHAATSNLDGYITIRDRETLEPELSFQLDEQSLRLGFIVNDRFLTVTTPSGTVALIEWRRQELVEAACAKLSRQTLTPAESRRYFGDQPADDGCRKVPYAARYAPAVVARLESQIEAEQARRLRDMQRAYDAAIPFNPPQPPVQAVISQPELPSPTGLPTLEQLKSLPTASLGVETKQTVLRVLAGAGDFAAAFAVLETIPVGGDERASWLITLTGMMVRSGAKDVEPLIAHAKQEFAKLSPESLPRWVAVARSNGDAGVLIPERLAATLQPVTLTPRDELFEVSEAAAGHARLKERAAANAEALRAIEVAKKLTWFDPGDLHAVTDAATEIARGAVEGSDRDLLSHAVALLDVIRPETLRYPPSLSPHPPSLGFDAIARGLASIALEAAEGGWSEDARRLLKAAAEKAASIRTPIERAVMYSELTRTALRLGNAAAAAEYAESAATAAKAVGETINDYVKQEALTEAAGALSAVGLATDDESKLARAEDLITAAVQVAQFGGSRQFGAVTVGVTIGVATSSQRDVNRLVALLERGTKDEVEVLRNLRTAIEQLDRKSDQPFRAEVIEVAVQRTLAAKNNTARSDSAIALLWYASSREQIIQLVAAVHDVGFDARAKALSYGIMAAERLGITPPARD